MAAQEFEVQQKHELDKKEEQTIAAQTFLPNTDIFEIEDASVVVMEMPGVERAHADITVEDDVPSASGQVDLSKYENLRPIYTEYNGGHYLRSFSLAPNSFDEHKICAEMKDGVLEVILPKAGQVRPRKIELQ
jgi:HSP20 family protein